MISSLRGVLLRSSADQIVVDVGGVGYGVRTPLSTLFALEQREGGLESPEQIELLVHTHVREDAIELFGFLTEIELRLFELLVSVSGIGPRLAQVILSGLPPQEVVRALSSADVPQLVRIPGIGKKTAERMVLELRDKAGELLVPGEGSKEAQVAVTGSAGDMQSDALSALRSLGYRPKEAERAVAAAFAEAEAEQELTLQELLRRSLRRLSKV